jgi:CRISPR-associated protein Cas2
MRTLYLVTYDISDSKRLQKVFKVLRGFGDHLQLSVFRCELSGKEKQQLLIKLNPIIHHDKDQVLIFPLGPAGGEIEDHVESLGKAYQAHERCAIIV